MQYEVHSLDCLVRLLHVVYLERAFLDRHVAMSVGMGGKWEGRRKERREGWV